MSALETAGVKWADGGKPTKSIYMWSDYGSDTCVEYRTKGLLYDHKNYYVRNGKDVIELTEDDFKPKDVKEKEMTLKEKIDLLCAKEIVLHVPTKELFIKVCGELKQRGIKWRNGSFPCLWDFHREATVMDFNDEGVVTANRNLHRDKVVVEVTENDFKPKESPTQQVTKVVLESAKKQAGKKEPLDAMCGGIEKVTFVSTHGDSRTFYVKTSKEGDAYIIREVAIPKFAKGEKFTDENGVLGRIDDIHDHTYDCETVTGEKYALRIDEADKKFKKITW